MLTGVFKKHKAWLLAIHIVLGTFMFGYSLGTSNTSDHYIRDIYWKNFLNNEIWYFTICVPGGALLGSLLAGYVCDKFGRRKALICGDFIMILGSGLTALTFYSPLNPLINYCLGRFICGISSGIFLAISPMYLNEITPDSLTSQLGPLVSISINLGYCTTYFFSLKLPLDTYNANHDEINKLLFYLFLFPVLVSLYQCFYFLVFMKYDSPKWYIDKGMNNRAEEALLLIYPKFELEKGITRFEERESEMSVSREDEERPKNPSFVNILMKDKYKKMVRIGFMLGIIQQISGFNVILLNSNTIFYTIVVPRYDPNMVKIYNCVIGIALLLGSIIAIPLLRKFGTKTLIISGEIFLAIVSVVLGVFYYIIPNMTIALIGIIVYMLIFAYSLEAALWTYIGEVCLDKIIPISAFTNMLSTCLMLIFCSYFFLEEAGICYILFFFSVCMILSSVYCLLDLVHTKGKTKPEIKYSIYNS